jgi:hypothetical protein
MVLAIGLFLRKIFGLKRIMNLHVSTSWTSSSNSSPATIIFTKRLFTSFVSCEVLTSNCKFL